MKCRFIVVDEDNGIVESRQGDKFFQYYAEALELAKDKIVSGYKDELYVCEVKAVAKRSVTVE